MDDSEPAEDGLLASWRWNRSARDQAQLKHKIRDLPGLLKHGLHLRKKSVSINRVLSTGMVIISAGWLFLPAHPPTVSYPRHDSGVCVQTITVASSKAAMLTSVSVFVVTSSPTMHWLFSYLKGFFELTTNVYFKATNTHGMSRRSLRSAPTCRQDR